jgi:hypothetical protein
MGLPKDKRETGEQVVAFAKKAIQQNEFRRSRRDPDYQFRRDRTRKLWDGSCLALESRDRAAQAANLSDDSETSSLRVLQVSVLQVRKQ